MLTRAVLLAALLGLASPAWAYDEAAHAEYQRLHEKMTNLAQRNQWQGVERAYHEMLDQKLPMEHTDHLLAADAARALGDVGALELRYERALAEWPNIELTQKLAEIKRQYGRVELLARAGGVKLVPDERPFQPDLAAAIDFAEDVLQETGRFEGVLPLGGYTMAGQHFEVKLLQTPETINVRRGGEDDPVDLPDDVPPQPGGGGNAARIALLGGAGASAVAAGVLYGMALSAKGQYYADDIMYDELDPLAQRANSLATVSLVAGGAAVGLGVTGVFVVDF